MSAALDLVKKYFAASNRSDFAEIKDFFTDSTHYRSATTGEFFGRDEILKMQKNFHGKFDELRWEILKIREPEPGTAEVDFAFFGRLPTGKEIHSRGLEIVKIADGKITEIEIRPV